MSSTSTTSRTMDIMSPEERSRMLVKSLACVLQKLVDVNGKLDNPSNHVITKFHASRPPSISIADYLERINKYASFSMECLVLALIYIDRLIQQSNFALTALNVHRVIITSVMLAAKFFDDQYFNNLYYAKVGGVPCKEINSLEVEFLFLINFSLHVSEEVYFRYYNELTNHASTSACCCCYLGSNVAISAKPAIPSIPSPLYSQFSGIRNEIRGGVGVGGGLAQRPVSPMIQPPVTPPSLHYQQQQQQSEVVGNNLVVGVVTAVPAPPTSHQFPYFYDSIPSSSTSSSISCPPPPLLAGPAPGPPPSLLGSRGDKVTRPPAQHYHQEHHQHNILYVTPKPSKPPVLPLRHAATPHFQYPVGQEQQHRGLTTYGIPSSSKPLHHQLQQGEALYHRYQPQQQQQHPGLITKCSSNNTGVIGPSHEYHHQQQHLEHYQTSQQHQQHLLQRSQSASSRAASLCAQYPQCYGVQVLMHS